jgi:HEAT repeat protein
MNTLASEESAGRQLRELVSELKPDEVLDALRYLSSMGKLSSHAMRILESLATTVNAGEAAIQPAPPALIAELVQLFEDEDIDRFNPPDHQSLLGDMSVTVPAVPAGGPEAMEQLRDRVDTVADETVNLQVARSLMELVGKFGGMRPSEKLLTRVEGIVQAQVASGQFTEALEIVQRLREIASITGSGPLQGAALKTLARLASQETMESLVAGLLAAPPEKSTSIHWLIDALGTAAMQALLIALAEESNRSRRRKLFDFLAALGPKIVPDVRRFLGDSRWYVVRNMILLLRSVNDTSSLAEIRRLAENQDLRVRLEAIKTLLTLDQTVPQALLAKAIHDPDPKMAETAIALVGSYGIKEGVGPLLKVLEGKDVFGARRPLRLRAIKALGELAAPEALPAIERFFSESFLPWPNRAERRAAWESLAGYPAEARAPFVEKGLQSRDSIVRGLCRRIAEGR